MNQENEAAHPAACEKEENSEGFSDEEISRLKAEKKAEISRKRAEAGRKGWEIRKEKGIIFPPKLSSEKAKQKSILASEARWGKKNNPGCLYCGSKDTIKAAIDRKHNRQDYKCKSCGKFFSGKIENQP